MFSSFLSKKLNKDEVAKILKTDKSAMDSFERSYKEHVIASGMSDNLFDVTVKEAAAQHEGIIPEGELSEKIEDMINRIVEELINTTSVWEYDGKNATSTPALYQKIDNPVTNEEILQLPEELRPWLTGKLMKVDINTPSYIMLMEYYNLYLKEKNSKKKQTLYNMFRQGLDILDVDDITYQIIDTNLASMGHWLPQIVKAVQTQEFFKVPKTTIIKVPVPLLQLTRCEYSALNRVTLDIVDRFCTRVFRLDENKDYFIKTGTYSSKYDFRNAYVHDAKEVKELGEYLLFIHYQACMMASPLNNVSITGVSTTTEWVVREFIHDKENNPCIYNGLPLHTEYRVFVDFDTKKIIGINPYWDPDVMKRRFGEADDSDTAKNVHDYFVYLAHEETLMARYDQNKDLVCHHVENLLNDVEDIEGQWSLDIMQNGDDFWIIDMAPAALSALIECVPKELLKPYKEDWMPKQISFTEKQS